MVRARRAMGRDDVLRLHGFVKRADALAERRCALNVAVGEPPGGKRIEKGGLVLAGQREQLVERDGIHARFRNVVACADLPFVHPFLHGKRFDIHDATPFRRPAPKKQKDARGIPYSACAPYLRNCPDDLQSPHPVMRKAMYFSWMSE